MSSSDDGATFMSCLASIGINNNNRAALEASDIPLSQESDPQSPERPLLTQAPAQSFSDDDDDNDEDEGEFHSLSPHGRASVNQDTNNATPASTNPSTRSQHTPETSVSSAPMTSESDAQPARPTAGLIDIFANNNNSNNNKKNNSILASSPESHAQDSNSKQNSPQEQSNRYFMVTQPPAEHEIDEESSVEECDNVNRSSNRSDAEKMPSPEPCETKTAPESPASNNSEHSNGFHAMMNDDDANDLEPRVSSPSAIETSLLQKQSSQTTYEDDSDSSSSSDEDEDDIGERIKRINKENERRRLERRRRNHDRMLSLGLISSPFKSQPSPTSTHSTPGKSNDNDMDDIPNGMLLMPCQEGSLDDAVNIDDLYKRFPHREGPIKTLLSLIGTTMGQTEHQEDDPFVPPPIFVSGPSGSGKTSIVRDVVETLQRHYSARLSPKERRVIGTAYVDCAAIEPSSMEAVLENAYSQLVPAELSYTTKRGKKTKKRKKDSTNEEDPKAKQLKRANRDGGGFGEQMSTEDVGLSIHSNDGEYNSDNEAVLEDKMEAIQALATQVETEETMSVESAVDDQSSRRKTRQSLNGAVNRHRSNGANIPNTRAKTIQKSEAVPKSHGAPVAFGRVLGPLFGRPSRLSAESEPGSAFLILDHAERLFTLSATQKAEPNNFLAQLLLLPQVMKLNLTVIIISRRTLLDCSRINNSASVQKALGIIANGIRPVHVHFPAYRGQEIFKAILKNPRITELIIGRSIPSVVENRQQDDPARLGFQETAVDSFVDTVVQSLSSVTRDTREMIRIGRALWPTYILPLDPRNIQRTFEAARQRLQRTKKQGLVESVLLGSSNGPEYSVKDLQWEILSILDEAILPRMKKCLEEELFVIKGDDTHSSAQNSSAGSSQYDLPYLSKCLLLAAFVCQSNKPDKDKALFTIQKNGKKNSRQGHRTGNNDAEALAYGSTTWEQQRLKMLRPRTFPLERMLSVFVNIVGLIGGEEQLRSSNDDTVSFIGSACFFENLARLREIGLLHEVQSSSTGGGDGFGSFAGINMTTTKYWCDMNREDADVLAASVNFSLENFLI